MRVRGRWAAVAVVAACAGGAGAWQFGMRQTATPGQKAPNVFNLASGLTATLVGITPERVTALAVDPRGSSRRPIVFSGGGRRGGIYRTTAADTFQTVTVATPLGDDPQFGNASVMALAFRDITGNRSPEFVALTSQELPIGSPRVHVWSAEHGPLKLLGSAAPRIASSWPHGIGFGVDESTGRETIISAYCGHGEVMEYRLPEAILQSKFDSTRFATLGLEGRQIDKLPASGEQAGTGLLGYGSTRRLVIAVGYSVGNAAIRVYGRPTNRNKWVLEHELSEGGRFGNVRFLLANRVNSSKKQIVAWWCTEIAGGRAEMVVYDFDGVGRNTRRSIMTGEAEELWPCDNQMAMADVDGDGRREIWFATHKGAVRRWDAEAPRAAGSGSDPIAVVADLPDGAGPLCVAPHPKFNDREIVFVGSQNRIVSFSNDNAPPSVASGL